MATVLYPWQILVAAMAGWITRKQDAVIDYLREENRVLKQQLGRRRLRLTDDQRRRLAVGGKASAGVLSPKSRRSSLPTPSFDGTGSWLPRSGRTSGDPQADPGLWRSSPTW